VTRPSWRHVLRRSLRVRLVLLFVLLALATASIFLLGMQRALSGGWSTLVRPLVSDYVDRLAADLGTPPDPARAQALAQRLPLSVRIDGAVVQYDSHPGARHWHRDAPPDDDDARLLESHTGDGHRIRFGLDERAWEARPRAIGWLTLAGLLLATAVAYAFVRHLFRPLDDIRDGARRFGQGAFDDPIPVRRHDELGDLAAQVNAMAQDIRAMLDAKRGLLLAVSHELRSPLTRARINAELVTEGPAREALLRDLGAMRDLIGDLLESERLAAGHGALQRERCNLNTLVQDVAATQFAEAGLQLRLDPALPERMLDPARIRLLVRNLIDNALRHGATASTPPRLETSFDGGRPRLVVRDFGPGVDAAHLALLGEPFHRPDAARQRSTGGVGLGLYLCRAVARAHGGELSIRNAAPGLEVAFELGPDPG
jgi:signal transduction histidine kinase